MMNTLAGFDFIFELSPAGLLAMVQARPELSSLSVPFERTVDLPDTQGGGTAHFVFETMDLSLVAGRPRLRLGFTRSSILGNSSAVGPDGHGFRAMRGHVDIDIPVTLATLAMDPGARELAVDFSAAQVSCVLDQPRNVFIQGAIGVAVSGFIVGLGRLAVPLPIRVDPAATPSVTPLVVRELQLFFYSPAEVERQSIALFGNFFQIGGGNPASRAASGVPAGMGFRCGLSPAAFHGLLFVPAVQRSLGVSAPELLPPSGGSATAVTYPALPDWSVTRVADTFRAGFVEVALDARNVTPGDFGNTIWVNVIGRLDFIIDGGTIRPSWTTTRAGGGREFGWAWWVTGIFLPGVFVTMGVAAGAVDAAAGSSAASIIPDLSSVAFSAPIAGVTVTAISIEEGQLSIDGRVPGPALRFAIPTVSLVAGRYTESRNPIDVGNYQSNGCPEGNYAFIRYAQSQRLTFTATPYFMALPVQTEWLVSGFNPPQAVAAPSGGARISAECTAGSPPGARVARDDVELTYEISGTGDTTLVIRNRPEDGSYAFSATCRVTDAEGRVVIRHGHGVVEGDAVTFGGTWTEDLNACVDSLQQALQGARGFDQLPPQLFVGGGEGGGGDPAKVWASDQDRFARAALAASLQGAKGAQTVANVARTLGVAALDQLSVRGAVAPALAFKSTVTDYANIYVPVAEILGGGFKDK